MQFFRLIALVTTWGLGQVASAAETNVPALIDAIKQVDKQGVGHRQAVEAVQLIQQRGQEALPAILRGMDEAHPLSINWLRGAFESIAERELKAGRELNKRDLEAFILDQQHGDHSRRLAYEWLARIDQSTPSRLLPKMLDDPSLELRYEAIERRLSELQADEVSGRQADIAGRYRQLLASARDPGQIKLLTEKLKSLGEAVDLPRHFGFVLNWKLIGPFSNSGGKGFSTAYSPEQTIDFDRDYPGKVGNVAWKDYTTKDDHGLVDLNQAIGKHMGAVAYAAKIFESEHEQPIELRLGCINACKVWLNGELLIEREVYHTGMEIDQYVGRGKLQPGRNLILVKVCQNEQTEDWAQNWQFQLRVCDRRGTAVLEARP